MKCIDFYERVLAEKQLREIFMELCSGIRTINEDGSRPWILVENKEQILCWIRAYSDDHCALCEGSVGDVVREKLSDSNKMETLKIVARIEVIK